MKKILSILGVVSLTATGASNNIACNKPKKQTLQKATDQQFANEIANIINKKKYFYSKSDDPMGLKKAEILELLKNFIKDKIKIENVDTSEFNEIKIEFVNINGVYFYYPSEDKLNNIKLEDIIIKYNNIESKTKINFIIYGKN